MLNLRPSFEECAAVVARYIAENRWPDAESCAKEAQRLHGFSEHNLIERAKELWSADPDRFRPKDMSEPYQVVAEMLEYFDYYRLATWAPLAAIVERERKPATDLHRPRPFCDWHEDIGGVLWWRMPISEPPYLGSPLDIGYTVGAQVIIGSRSSAIAKIDDMLGWPFSEADEPHLWWTPLPDAKRIEDQVPL